VLTSHHFEIKAVKPAVRASGNLRRSSQLPGVLQFMQVLWAVAHGLDRASKRMARQIGVTGPQRLVLRVVGLFPGLSAGDLASVLHVHPSTLTGVLQRLAEQQLLKRLSHPHDRRRAVLHLTARGVRANDTQAGTVEAAVARALAGISSRDRVAARRVLEQLAAQLGSLDDGGSAPSQRTSTAGRRVTRRT
jgi:DNA-binding MarR family transcriptional regulator